MNELAKEIAINAFKKNIENAQACIELLQDQKEEPEEEILYVPKEIGLRYEPNYKVYSIVNGRSMMWLEEDTGFNVASIFAWNRAKINSGKNFKLIPATKFEVGKVYVEKNLKEAKDQYRLCVYVAKDKPVVCIAQMWNNRYCVGPDGFFVDSEPLTFVKDYYEVVYCGDW